MEVLASADKRREEHPAAAEDGRVLRLDEEGELLREGGVDG